MKKSREKDFLPKVLKIKGFAPGGIYFKSIKTKNLCIYIPTTESQPQAILPLSNPTKKRRVSCLEISIIKMTIFHYEMNKNSSFKVCDNYF